MTATDELRRLLDERGVEWSSPSGLSSRYADRMTFIGDVAVVSEIDGSDLLRINFDGTPEQAVEATLGAEEIVRCRDCNWFFPDDLYGDACRWFCRKNDNPDGFCSWGERKVVE